RPAGPTSRSGRSGTRGWPGRTPSILSCGNAVKPWIRWLGWADGDRVRLQEKEHGYGWGTTVEQNEDGLGGAVSCDPAPGGSDRERLGPRRPGDRNLRGVENLHRGAGPHPEALRGRGQDQGSGLRRDPGHARDVGS